MTTAVQKVEAVAVTVVGSTIGALAGGPVGLAVGLVVGAAVDMLRARHAQTAPMSVLAAAAAADVAPAPAMAPAAAVSPIVAAAMTPGAPALPASADKDAARRATVMIRIGKPAELKPAQAWLMKFQVSVGLPPNGKLDNNTRSLLMLADPEAMNIPLKTFVD